MRKLLIILPLVLIIFSCDNENHLTPKRSRIETILPDHIKSFGKDVASEIKQTVSNLNNMKVDYSDANRSFAFIEQYYKDWNSASCSKTRSDLQPSEFRYFLQTGMQRKQILSPIQNKYIDRIIDECSKSRSLDDLTDILTTICIDITENVPLIEQERLFCIISIIHFGLSELQQLINQGKMVPTSASKINVTKIKTRSECSKYDIEGSSNNFTGNCRDFYTAVCTFVVGMSTGTGEIIAAISTTTLSCLCTMFVITMCLTGDSSNRTYCTDKYVDCQNNYPEWAKAGSGGMGKSMCDVCRQYCMTQGYWDCPRPL